MSIPIAGVAHQAGTCRFGHDPADVGARRELQGARARQPLRRRHELLPEHRRGEPGAHGDGERDPRRRAPARAHRRSGRMATRDRDRGSSTWPGSCRASRWSRSRRPATIFTSPADYGLSSTQYGAMFLPQVVLAIAASLLGGRPGDAVRVEAALPGRARRRPRRRWRCSSSARRSRDDEAVGVRVLLRRDRVPRGRLRARPSRRSTRSPRRSTPSTWTGRCSCSTRCSGSARRWRRCSSRSSSGSASGGGCRC